MNEKYRINFKIVGLGSAQVEAESRLQAEEILLKCLSGFCSSMLNTTYDESKLIIDWHNDVHADIIISD